MGSNTKAALATFIGVYQVERTTYGSYTNDLYQQRLKNLEDDWLLSGDVSRYAYLLRNHFRFSLVPIALVTGNPIPTDFKQVVSLYNKDLIAGTKQEIPRHPRYFSFEERRLIQDPSLTIEDIVCRSFFKESNEINDEMLRAPYFIHRSYSESIVSSPSAFIRREMSLALLALMGALNSERNEEVEHLFKRQMLLM